MKKILFVAIMALCSVMSFTSCSSSFDEEIDSAEASCIKGASTLKADLSKMFNITISECNTYEAKNLYIAGKVTYNSYVNPNYATFDWDNYSLVITVEGQTTESEELQLTEKLTWATGSIKCAYPTSITLTVYDKTTKEAITTKTISNDARMYTITDCVGKWIYREPKKASNSILTDTNSDEYTEAYVNIYLYTSTYYYIQDNADQFNSFEYAYYDACGLNTSSFAGCCYNWLTNKSSFRGYWYAYYYYPSGYTFELGFANNQRYMLVTSEDGTKTWKFINEEDLDSYEEDEATGIRNITM